MEMGGNLSGLSEDSAGQVVVGRFISFEILSVVLQLLSIVFNGAIICTLCRRSLLKYPSNRFVFSLCISHLTVSFLSILISLLTAILPSSHYQSLIKSDQHDFSHPEQGKTSSSFPKEEMSSVPVRCVAGSSSVDMAHLVMMHINFGVAVCTSITVALISAERYITIARPMRYKSIVTARRTLYAIICCWLLASLITMMPLLLFENRNPTCGTFSVPMEILSTYFGIVFTVVTLFGLAVMIVCYAHIFRIAKAKCQKVQIGHFTASTVSSISSDWPSSVYSSVQGQHRFLHAGSRIESSNSLLHSVLMSNLGRHVHPLSRLSNFRRGRPPLTPPATPVLPPKNAFFSDSALNNRRESDETTTTGASNSRNGSTSSSSSAGGGNPNYFIDPSRSPFQYHHLPNHRKLRNRWKTYLQPNYNSPRKTVFTIVLLIGAVMFTQLPLSFVLFTSTVETTQRWFQFCTTVLFSTSSVANPVLYGFLNRNIRDQLWRLLKRKPPGTEHGPSASSIRKRKRGQQQLDEITQNSRSILSTANHHHLRKICRSGVELPAIKISRKESISSDDNSINSVTSTNNMNAIGTTTTSSASSAKAKINQVQKRIASSPYYRTVLMKKANNNKSLLPRLVLPDVNVRRNSSGSIISISTNGVMSTKGKVKEGDKEWDGSSLSDKNTTSRQEISIEMQSFHNYSTPDLPLSSQPVQESNNCGEKIGFTADGNASTDDIETISQNKSEGRKFQDVTLPHENAADERCNELGEEVNATSSPDQVQRDGYDNGNVQPGPSRVTTKFDPQQEHPDNLDNCLIAENFVGVGIDEELLPENFPRKPSQDSGADMSFSDEEDDASILPLPTNKYGHSSPGPVLLSAASLSSLPAMMPTRLAMGANETDADNSNAYSTTNSSSLAGPLLLIGHPDDAGNFRNLANPTDIFLLPCSCANNDSDDNTMSPQFCSNRVEDEWSNKVENGVTVTITDSNSDTQLFSSNRSLLHVQNDLDRTQYRHHPQCSRRVIRQFKSKSESDICTVNKVPDCIKETDFKMRSNCHISYSEKSNSLHNSNDAFTVSNDYSHNHVKRGISPSCCSVWASNGQLPVLASSFNQQYLLESSSSPIAIPTSQSGQWLSVMSVHSSCSSLSSTCPLKFLDGYNKSDTSDYDDLEDHIEI